MENGINVLSKMQLVMNDLPWVGKDGMVKGGGFGYAYATEAGFIAAIRPLFVEHGLMILPIEVHADNTKTDVSGKITYVSNVHVVYRIYDTASGEFIEITMVGAGNDSGDKAVYKAMTGAFKYALREAFMIGTGDDPEATDEDGNDTEQSVIAKAVEKLERAKGKLSKEHVELLKNNGYVFGRENGIPHRKTAKLIDAITDLVKSGQSMDAAIASLIAG